METFWLNGRTGAGNSDAGSISATVPSAPPAPPPINSNRVFQHRESTPLMENETRLPSADSPDLPNYDEAKGMYRQATWD